MRLSEMPIGSEAVIVKVLGHGAFRKRVMEMGFVRGRTVKVLQQAPLNDPVKYSIMGYEVSLRRSEASMIEVDPISLPGQTPREREEQHEAVEHAKKETVINVALIGNPNCGKTSLFNIASGAKEHVGNYSGVTVDAKTGHFDYKGYRFNIVDLPGTYSLTSYSPEELYVRNYLRDYSPDVIINVVDASNLERNLYLATELIDMDRSMVIALNTYDEVRESGAILDYKMLGEMIGVPMVPIVAKTGEGVDKLFDAVIKVYEGKHEAVRHIHVNLGADIEKMLRQLIDAIKAAPDIGMHFSPRYIAIKLLEGDQEANRIIGKTPEGEKILELRDQLLKQFSIDHTDADIQELIAAEKYGFIAGALAETYKAGEKDNLTRTHVIDDLVTNKLFGFPIFFLIMFFIFWATFAIGQYPMDWIEDLVAWLSQVVNNLMPDGMLKDMIADGIIGGVGGVIVFLPNILILYFCISFMEDSGYMARAAFIMDKVMHRIGLHGKSFIPLVMGFGCNVPAIMASRSIESRSSRIITILINPFMSCSARLPIYVLLIGTFFPKYPAAVFMGLYILGIIVAMVTAKLLRKFYFKADETPFVMELPPYRIPTFKASMRHTWAKGEQYLKKMGGIILVASIVVWALNYFPIRDGKDQAEIYAEVAREGEEISPNDSYLEMAGKFINPVLSPLGFHWRASVAALAGVPAKEIVVSTLGVLYAGDEAETNERLGERLEKPNPITHKPDFTHASALSFMIFILLYCPCIATITAIVKETHSWRYGAFSIVYNTLVAWALAFAAYRIALLF
ncbi:MAG: ferrous iron transport protein B [Bacteroidales bacterium]|nr:ferrous iron transport protein B [Bacteroidales bacterium]